MKYIISKDFSTLKNNKRILFTYIICLILFCIFTKFISSQIEVDNVEVKTLGMLFSHNFLDMLMYVLNMTVYIYVCISFFLSDIRHGGQNVFLRFTKRKYFLLKFCSMAFFILMLKIIGHAIVHICYLSPFSFNIFLKDILYTLIVDLLVIVLYIINILSKKILYILILILVIFLSLNLYLLSSINLSLGSLIIVNVFLMFIYMYLNKFLFDIYERND